MPEFLREPIKAFKWEKFFEGETSFLRFSEAMKYHPKELYTTMEREKVSFRVIAINELYKLPDKVEA